MANEQIPIQPVPQPVICSPYGEPADHWIYDTKTGQPLRAGRRRDAGYWYKTQRTGSAQGDLFAEEERDDLPLINALRKDVKRWREADYRGASNVTKDLLRYWARKDRARRLFFCQMEAVETVIYLAEMRFTNRARSLLFSPAVSDEDLAKMLRGEKPSFEVQQPDFFPRLIDQPADASLLPLLRLGCKMATGSGKTVVMAMLIAWAFCNRGQNPQSREYPNGVLVCCPNLTVKERLQVLRPEMPGNYYDQFDIVPSKYRAFLQKGKVLVTNWHMFAPESEHVEGDRRYAVVNKGPETPETLARRVLADLYDRLPIMVLNDEGHHCWRPAPLPTDDFFEDAEPADLDEEAQEARVWLNGLDWINNCDIARTDKKPQIRFCVDLSATPFYIGGSGYPEGRPFPWLTSDFGLVDAIESGIVKIPRLPVKDDSGKKDEAGRPDPKYFRLWHNIVSSLQPAEKFKRGKPKPDVLYREAEGALTQIAGQWHQRFEYMHQATPGQESIPPVLIVVCDNTDIAQVFYEKISGEREEPIVTQDDVDEVLGDEDNGTDADEPAKGLKKAGKKMRTVYGESAILPELANTPSRRHTLRIDTKLLAKAESEDPDATRQDAAQALRRIVATVGKRGEPGEHIRCVVSVGMLTEGWDANNVTHVLGVRAFGSQLLCEQVVGRGLRRINYTPDAKTGLLSEEYVDVYGIPFSVIPFKGRTTKQVTPEDKPKNRVYALPERIEMEIRYPVVEGYAFALKRNVIKCDIAAMEPLTIDPRLEPTTTFLGSAAGYKDTAAATPVTPYIEQDRDEYYRHTHLQTVLFRITQLIVENLLAPPKKGSDRKRAVLNLQARHQLFPQVWHYVREYVNSKVDFRDQNPCELGLQKYAQLVVERLCAAIHPNDAEGEPPLLPILNRFKPIRSTEEVDFVTIRPCRLTVRSHINQVVLDAEWEGMATEVFEASAAVKFYARNDQLGLRIPYTFLNVEHTYEPDFLLRLANDVTVLLEVKGYMFGHDEQVQAKHEAARKWIRAVNNWGGLGYWDFHVSRDITTLGMEMGRLLAKPVQAVAAEGASRAG